MLAAAAFGMSAGKGVTAAKASKLRSRLRALKSERRLLAAAAFRVSIAKASKLRSRLRALQPQFASA
jgi:hypothetical protein